ncbi:hypothetical protein FOCC_FOCC008054 [Frankliniella occidentalis]|nr:hypothetical protein FOCC_FOCC008054 [Frankliniella occidentalis]
MSRFQRQRRETPWCSQLLLIRNKPVRLGRTRASLVSFSRYVFTMDNLENCRRRRKRGPYIQYHFRDSAVPVPKSTLNELDHPERKRAKPANPPKPAVPRKKVLQDSQGINKQKHDFLTSTFSDVDPTNYLETPIGAASSDPAVSIDNGNGNVPACDFTDCDADVPCVDGFLDEDDDDNDESEQFQCMDEEELFDQIFDEPPDDPDDNQLDDDSSQDESEDDECATAPDLPSSVRDRVKLLLLLATKKRHNLTYTAAESVMKLSGLLNKDRDGFSPSKFLMKEAIDAYSSDMTVHYVCPNCGDYIGRIEYNVNICGNCQLQLDYNECKKGKSYFLYLSVKQQIKALLESGLSAHLISPQHRSKLCASNYEDVYDGKLYKRHVPKGALSFNIFVDGLQVASTSKHSAWPVLLTLNELPLHLRRKFVLMASVWLGKKKPDINQYMKPFVEECLEMYHFGIDYMENGVIKNVKIVCLMCISDSVARPLLRNSKQFNGRYGCGLCCHRGFRLRYGRGKITSYSLCNGEFPMRTHEETMELAREGDRTGTFHMGIRGTSILSSIPSFDIIHCLDLDIFHCLVNVAKRFTNLWIGKRRINEPYNVRTRLAVIDRRLLAITTIDDISRAPRSLTERSDFRGHEWFHWIVFYSLPVMMNILPPRYLNHWALLVHGVVLLMQNSVAKSEVTYASRYLKLFNEQIDLLYGRVHVTFSVHLLTHLENSTVNFAQPWTHSAFIYESFLGEIKASVKSGTGVAQQITKHMQLRIALQKMRADLEFAMSDEEKEYLTSVMSSSKTLANPHLVIGPVSLLGEPRRMTLSEEYRHALVRSDVAFDRSKEYPSYDRCIVNNELFQSSNYNRVKRQVNCVVLLESNKVFRIQSFIVISNVCYAIGHYFKDRRHVKVSDRALPHYRVLGENENMLRCIPTTQFSMKLISFTVKLSDEEKLTLGCVNVLKMEMLN